jgi:hypothetical protein
MFKACDQTWLLGGRAAKAQCQAVAKLSKERKKCSERLLWPTRNKTFVPDPEPRISIYVWRDVPLAVQTGLG